MKIRGIQVSERRLVAGLQHTTKGGDYESHIPHPKRYALVTVWWSYRKADGSVTAYREHADHITVSFGYDDMARVELGRPLKDSMAKLEKLEADATMRAGMQYI